MILIKHCTQFMILVVMVCITFLSTKWCLIIFNFTLVFKISLLFIEIYELISTNFINFNKQEWYV